MIENRSPPQPSAYVCEDRPSFAFVPVLVEDSDRIARLAERMKLRP